MMFGSEGTYVCDSCGESIVIPIDTSNGSRQEFLEDCPVCCNPNTIDVYFDREGNADVQARESQ